jgi:hypothetical protein
MTGREIRKLGSPRSEVDQFLTFDVSDSYNHVPVTHETSDDEGVFMASDADQAGGTRSILVDRSRRPTSKIMMMKMKSRSPSQ